MIGDEQSLRAFIREELDRSQMGALVRQSQGLIADLQGSTVKHGNLGVALQTTGGDVSSSFTLDRDATVLLAYTGTGYVTSAGVVAFLNCWLDGVFRGAASHPFNQAGLQLNMGIFADVVGLAAGTHTVRMSPGGNLSRDPNESNTVLYVAFG